MITATIGEEKVSIPEYLPIKWYQQIQKNPIRYNDNVNLLSLYLNKTPDEIRDYPKDNIDFIVRYINSSVLVEPESIKLENRFEYNGVKYGLENDWGNLKWGMWTDMEVFSQEDKINENIHIIMSILYRPIVSETKHKYTIEPYNSTTTMERAEIMKEVDTRLWLGAATFFLEMSQQYIKNMQRSLAWKMVKYKMIILMDRLMKKIPTFLLPKKLRDFISNSLINYQTKILQSLDK